MKKRVIVFVLVSVIALSVGAPTAFAAVNEPKPVAVSESYEGIVPYKDDIRYKFKTENGVLYRRLWNYTKLRWEQPNWERVK